MPLDDQRGRWIQRTSNVLGVIDPILDMLPPNARVTTSMLSGFRETLESDLHTGEADTPPAGSPLAAITGPFLMSLRQFHALTDVPTTGAELRALLADPRDAAHTAHLALTTDSTLAAQTVDEVITEFAQEYRISLILALTANHALSQTVTRWQESKRSDSTTGDHLDLTTMSFLSAATDRTIAMSTLASASTADPVMMTPKNLATSIQIMMTGGTPPPIYQLAYTQWFTNIHAAWEDTYRGRLATAHGTDSDGKPWAKNDIPSEFFNEIRQIRHDISHKRGVCVESAGNTIIDWGESGETIAPTPRQMLGLLDQFPHDELRRAPTRSVRTNSQLPYQFPNEWIETVKAHIEAIEPVKKKRVAVLKQLIDDAMTTATPTSTAIS
ncbi:hypothetical protein LQL77_30510 [Rhodococcus cerastii]|nr:hypothetical protein [Rhodococcus cerastii]